LIISAVESWKYLDSLYWAVITITTVKLLFYYKIGYGDISPSSIGGKIFTIFYGFGGIGFLSILFNTLTSIFLYK
jgi:voltage-gated potassium channel